MSLLFADSMDHYTLADVQKKWHQVGASGTLSNTNSAAASWPAGGGVQVWRGPSATSSFLRWNSRTSDATVVMGGWFYFEGLSSGTSNYIFQAWDSTGTICWDVRRDATGHLIFTRANGTILTTSTNTFSLNTWYFIEAKVTTDSAAGVYEVRVNGSSVGWVPQVTGANTRGAGSLNSTNMYLFQDTSQNSSATQCRSLYVLNSSGSVANTFLGMNIIHCLRPYAPGNYSQWTPNGGNNLGAVNDINGDGDLCFNMSATVNQIDTFVYQDLPSTGTVFAVQHVLEARQDGGAGRTVAALERLSNTDFPGTTKQLAGTHLFLTDPSDTDPATSAQYTAANINAAEYGYKLIS